MVKLNKYGDTSLRIPNLKHGQTQLRKYVDERCDKTVVQLGPNCLAERHLSHSHFETPFLLN